MNIAEILMNGASGGLVGIAGTIIGEGIGILKGHMTHKQGMERTRLEGELNAAKTAGEVAVAREKGAADAFTESQRAEGNIRGEFRWATTYRSITRPSLTHAGLLASIIFGFFPPTTEAGAAIVATINAYTGMMIAWWFGQRAIDRSAISWGSGSVNASVKSTQTK